MLTLTSREISRKETLCPPRRTLAGIPKRCLVVYTPPEARGSILRDCNHLWRSGPRRGTGAQIRLRLQEEMLDILPEVPLLFEHGSETY